MQPNLCIGCGGGYLQKECPEKENSASTPAYCKYQLMEGEKPHPAKYRGCRHTKEELQKRKSQRSPKTTTGRVFSSNLTTPSVSFAAALGGSTRKSSGLRFRLAQVPEAVPTAAKKPSVPAPV
jgi:hypothetical protein